jgi:VWFA-related protein
MRISMPALTLLATVTLVPTEDGRALARQASPQGSREIFRSATRLVQVEVVVRDGAGKVVSGLTKDDFRIIEDGKPQEVRFFNVYQRGTRPAPEVPTGMVSNRPEVVGTRRGVTVIMIDGLNTPWESTSRALLSVSSFLNSLQPDDHVAIYTLGRELKIVHDFTSDVRSLKKRIEQYKGSPLENRGEGGELLDAMVEGDLKRLLEWGRKTEEDARNVARTQDTLSALEAVANHLGATPGWKSLVWIGGGVPMQVGMGRSIPSSKRIDTGPAQAFDREFQQAVRALTTANVAVYPVQPEGARLAHEARGAIVRESDSLLRQLADQTGGRAYIDDNDISGALKQVANDVQASYTVAYYPTNSRFDGQYRKIEIRVNKRDLEASHRRGYYAVDTAGARAESAEQELRAAALDPLDASAIGIDAGLRKTENGQEVFARIDSAGLLWAEQNGFNVETWVGVFQYDADARLLASVVDKIEFRCDAKKAALLSRNGLSYSRPLILAPAAVRLRFIVRSTRTGAIGSVTIPLP